MKNRPENKKSQKRTHVERIVSFATRVYGSIHFFPFICLILLLGLTVFKISGSSVGLYNQAFYGSENHDQNLLAHSPRGVRSDELLHLTPTAVGQVETDMNVINPTIGRGEDVSVVLDAPYREWSALFRPQNFAFFVLPLEYAFAFKWWLLAFLLLISCYYLCLALLPNKRLWAALIAIMVFFSPFVQWWYQTGTLACLFYSFFIALTSISLLRTTSKTKQLLLGGLLAYELIAFALITYPPFQIPCALVTGIFLLGFLLDQRRRFSNIQLWRTVGIISGAAAIALLVIFIYLKTRADVVALFQHTAYPGQRVVDSGGFSINHFFSNYLMGNLQSSERASHYFMNQSEASNFLLISPFLFIPALYVTVSSWLKERRILWSLILTNSILVLLLARLFIPHLNPLFDLLQLSAVPHNRLLIGIGLASILQLIILLQYRSLATPLIAWASALIGFVVSLIAGLLINQKHPGFIESTVQITLLSGVVGGIIYLVLSRRDRLITLGLTAFALLACFSTISVHPLYRGLGPLISSDLIQAVKNTGDSKDIWAVADSRLLVTIPLAAGKPAITNIYTYPQKELWQPIDPTRQNEAIYNRFAHVILQLQPDSSFMPDATITLGADDYFTVQTTTCTPFLKQAAVKFILTPTLLADPQCASLKQTITYPASTFYIYELHS